MNQLAIKIDFISNYPQYVESLAHWYHEAWGHLAPALTEAERIYEIESFVKSANPTHQCIIALVEGKLLGTAAIIENDLEAIDHGLSPWLSSVYVQPSARHQGIGSMLVQAVENLAAKENYASLHLFTADQQTWYQAQGWLVVKDAILRGHPITIMQKHLKGNI